MWMELRRDAVTDLVRIPLEDGASILVEASRVVDGPVPAGRLREMIHGIPADLGVVLGPVTEMARTVLGELRGAGPDEVQVEFGVDLAVQAGAVITKGEAGCHLKVTMAWRKNAPGPNADSH